MTIPERALFVHKILTAEQLQISAALAGAMAECQEWLASMADTSEPNLKAVKGDDEPAKKV